MVVVELGAKGQLVKQNVTFELTQILKTLIVLENQIDFLSDSIGGFSCFVHMICAVLQQLCA